MSWEWMLAAASTVFVGIGDGRAACFTAAVLAQSQAVPVQIRHGHIQASTSACEKSQQLLVSLHAWHAMDHFLEGSWRRCVEDVGCHVCPESAHGACLPEPMTLLDALEFHGTFIDVPKEVALLPQANFRFDDELRLDVTPGTGDHVFLMPGSFLIPFMHTVSMKRALPSWAAS